MENRLYPNWQQLNEQNNPLTDGERAKLQEVITKKPSFEDAQKLLNEIK